ncbi:MAG: hypothetical protein WCO56_15225 [Verrucomicrobiota bacterium]
MHLRSICFAVAALLLAPLAPLSAAESAPGTSRDSHLKFESDFRDGLAGWQTQGKAQFTHDPTVGHNGNGAARLTIPAEGTPSWQQYSKTFTPAIDDDEFQASVWVRTEGARDGTGAYMCLEFLDAKNQRASIAHSTVNLENGAKGWQRLTAEGTAPSNAVAVRVGLILHARGTAWFDEVRLERTRAGAPLPDLGNVTRIITIHPDTITQPQFMGMGFHAFHHTHPMSDTLKNEVVYKRWREINPSFARLNDSNRWTPEQKEEIADHLRRMKETGTQIYMAAWDPDDVPPGEARRAYAKKVADRLEWFRQKGADHILLYCLSNEMQMGRWGALLNDLPKFKDYHQELFNEFKARKLPIGLLATDASPLANWSTIEWAAQNMDVITAVYGGHHYFSEYAPDNPRFYAWFESRLKSIVEVAHAKHKEFILGEFGAKCDGRTINGKKMDACVYFDTPLEPFVGLQLAEAAIASLNAGVQAIGYWTFMDFPDTVGKTYANKWGLTKWSGDDLSTRDIHYAYGPLVRFFRGPAQAVAVETKDPWLRAGAVRHADGRWSIAVVNRYKAAMPVEIKLPIEHSQPLVFRKYLYDAVHVKKHPFGDLPGPVATLTLADALRDTLDPQTLVIYTTAYDNTPPAPVRGLSVSAADAGAKIVMWQPSGDADFCYYRVFRGPRADFTPAPDQQIASTIATHFTDQTPVPGAFYKVVAVDQSGNASQ